MLPRWAACLIGAVVCILVALWLAPLVPAPAGAIVSVLAWIGAVVLLVMAVLALMTGRGPRTPV